MYAPLSWMYWDQHTQGFSANLPVGTPPRSLQGFKKPHRNGVPPTQINDYRVNEKSTITSILWQLATALKTYLLPHRGSWPTLSKTL